MKDAAGSKKAFSNRIRSDVIDNHPEVFSIFLVLAFIILAGSAAFLISDILSFKSDGSHKVSLTDFHLQIPNGITTAIASWQAMGLKLIDQGKKFAFNIGTHNSTQSSQEKSTGDKGRILQNKNDSVKDKSSLAKAKLPILLPTSMNSSKSSRNNTSIPQSKSSITVISSSWESGSGSDSYWEKEPVKSYVGDHHVDATTMTGSSETGPKINQSTQDNRSNDNITDNLPILKIGADSNCSSDNLASANRTNILFNDPSSISIVAVTDNSSIKMSEVLSNNGSEQSNSDINSHENSDSSNKISETANGASQNSELNQNHLNTQTKAVTKASRSSKRLSNMPLLQKLNKNTEEVQASNKDSSASGKKESAKSKSESVSKFKKLKIKSSLRN